MTDDKDIRADHPELDEDKRDDPTLTRRITREDVIDPEGKTAMASTPEQASISGGVFQQMWRRIQEERKRPKRVELKTRSQSNMDRSKAFLVLATAVVLVGFIFLALFSSSGTRRSAGRPRAPAGRDLARVAACRATAGDSAVDPRCELRHWPRDRARHFCHRPSRAKRPPALLLRCRDARRSACWL